MVASAALLLPAIFRKYWLSVAIGLGWVTVDLLIFGMGYNPAISRDLYYPATPAIEWLKQDPANFRIWGEKSVLVPDTAEIYGLKDARGCDFMAVRRYEELITGTAGDFYFYSVAAGVPRSFPLLSVKYAMVFKSTPLDPGWFEQVYSNEVTIYRYRPFHERAMAVFNYQVEPDPASILARVRSGGFDPARVLLLEDQPTDIHAPSQIQTSTADTNSFARIVAEQADEVTITAFLSRPGFVLLLDTYFPGWTATVNGVKSPILRADYNFRAVQVPAGKSTVRFVYQPAGFRLGMVLFPAGLLVMAGVWFGPWKRCKADQ